MSKARCPPNGPRASRHHPVGVKVIERNAGRWAAPGHQRVQYAESVRVEPAKAFPVSVSHPESGKVSQRVEVSIPVVSLMDHTVLLVLPSVLPQETLQIPAVVIVATD